MQYRFAKRLTQKHVCVYVYISTVNQIEKILALPLILKK